MVILTLATSYFLLAGELGQLCQPKDVTGYCPNSRASKNICGRLEKCSQENSYARQDQGARDAANYFKFLELKGGLNKFYDRQLHCLKSLNDLAQRLKKEIELAIEEHISIVGMTKANDADFTGFVADEKTPLGVKWIDKPGTTVAKLHAHRQLLSQIRGHFHRIRKSKRVCGMPEHLDTSAMDLNDRVSEFIRINSMLYHYAAGSASVNPRLGNISNGQGTPKGSGVATSAATAASFWSFAK